MSLINKEKVLNGVGKAVDVTNKAADKASSFVKEKEIDRKAMKAAKTAEKGNDYRCNCRFACKARRVLCASCGSYFGRYFGFNHVHGRQSASCRCICNQPGFNGWLTSS